MIDRVAQELNRELKEVPVGFKWFVNGLLEGTTAFGGEESAGASFLRHDGSVWSTDKDGNILALLAAEICAITKQDPGHHYKAMTQRHGTSYYERMDAPASRKEKQQLAALIPENVRPKPSPVNPSSLNSPKRLPMEPPSEDLKSVQKMAGLLHGRRVLKIYIKSMQKVL